MYAHALSGGIAVGQPDSRYQSQTHRVAEHWPGNGCAVVSNAVARFDISLFQSPGPIDFEPTCLRHGRSVTSSPYAWCAIVSKSGFVRSLAR